MKLGIMQPYFFPYIGYFQLINAVDKFILYDNLNFIKEKWINRNRLLVINGKPIFFRIPLKEKSSFSKIRDIRIDNDQKWKKKLLNQFYCNYRRSLFFDEVFPIIEKSIEKDIQFLTDINCYTIQLIAEFLDISTEIVIDTSNYELLEMELSKSDSEIKSFYLFEQKLMDIKSIRVICICKNEQADTFINAIGGQKLYDKQKFATNGIQLFFVNTLPYSYKQNSAEFIQDLSILDVMMNCGKEGTKNLLSNYVLI